MNRLLIAQGSFTMVERCQCGAMYLTVGPVCMKLDPRALPELRETLQRAARVLEQHSGDDAAAMLAGQTSSVERQSAAESDTNDAAAGAPGRGHSCDLN